MTVKKVSMSVKRRNQTIEAMDLLPSAFEATTLHIANL
ncbi:hypothetical protein BVRB_5g125420 [Beta vulgaris subsp. vulgaris]|uniref:Uncharacterized protein n=1 Tax=Beta vulgaris subsp. vulgaris TaxID=3555 RepID=A0A0J8B8L3_BETVV|nr:hypothetical protein BVRB_5g125420 [Beta vulgaris subsp. vulgaris]